MTDISPETVDALTPDSRGTWLVTTVSGSTHVWNLDAGTVIRLPAGWSPKQLANDTAVQRIIGVVRFPKVGASSAFVLEGDPNVPGHARLRLTTAVKGIERLG
jgi:hypothetical protein